VISSINYVLNLLLPVQLLLINNYVGLIVEIFFYFFFVMSQGTRKIYDVNDMFSRNVCGHLQDCKMS
jgi:hypothetical protein